MECGRMVEGNYARVSSAKERCSLVRWSGPAALLQGREWIIVEVSSGVTQSGSSWVGDVGDF